MGNLGVEAGRYLACMTEMTARLYAAHDGVDKCLVTQDYAPSEFEFACLQMRKAIELIGYSGMIAEKEAYKEVSSNFGKDWNFSKIIKSLAKVSPNSFPFRAIKRRSEEEGVDWHFVPQSDYAIEPRVLIDWHGRLHEHLHAANPYRHADNQHVTCLRIKSNVTDIVNFLAEHIFLGADRSGGFIVSLHSRDRPVEVFAIGVSTDV